MKVFWQTKLIEVPTSNETRTVDAIQLWEVRWDSRHSEYSGGTRPEMEAFPTKEEADEFADSLRQAFRLIRHTSGDCVITRRAK